MLLEPYPSKLLLTCSLFEQSQVNITATYFILDRDAIRSGEYARNAVLIGTSLVNSFAFSFSKKGNLQSGVPILVFWSIALAPSTLVFEFLWNKKVGSNTPSLLLPFNVVLLGSAFSASLWDLAMDTQVLFQSPLEDNKADFVPHEAVLNGLSRIFFVQGDDWRIGFLMLIGVLFCSRIIAVSLVSGSFVATVVLGYLVFGEDHSHLNSGYAGANPALFMAGIFYYLVPSWKLSGFAVFGIMATLLVQGAVDVLLGIV